MTPVRVCLFNLSILIAVSPLLAGPARAATILIDRLPDPVPWLGSAVDISGGEGEFYLQDRSQDPPGASSAMHTDAFYDLLATANPGDLDPLTRDYELLGRAAMMGGANPPAQARAEYFEEMYVTALEPVFVSVLLTVSVEIVGNAFLEIALADPLQGRLFEKVQITATTAPTSYRLDSVGRFNGNTYLYDTWNGSAHTDTYIPITVTTRGVAIASGASVDWSHTVTLEDVVLSRLDGDQLVELSPEEYTLTPLSGSPDFPGNVPEPSAATLLLLGLAGLGLTAPRR